MSFVKYRLKEVAADFSVSPKEIAEIVGKFSEKPKSMTQVLTDEELNCVFDYMTQKNQISSIEQVFAQQSPRQHPLPSRKHPRQKTSLSRVSSVSSRVVPSSRMPLPRTISPSSLRSPPSPSVSASAAWLIPLLYR